MCQRGDSCLEGHLCRPGTQEESGVKGQELSHAPTLTLACPGEGVERIEWWWWGGGGGKGGRTPKMESHPQILIDFLNVCSQ